MPAEGTKRTNSKTLEPEIYKDGAWVTDWDSLVIGSTTNVGALTGGFIYQSSETPANNIFAMNGQTLTGGATNYPILAAKWPAWVSGADIVLPDWRGRAMMATGALGITGAIGATYADATAVNGLRTLRTYVQSDWNGQSNTDFGKGSGSLTGAANNSSGMSSSDGYTRPNAVGLVLCVIAGALAVQTVPISTAIDLTPIGIPLNATSERQYVLQESGGTIINRLAKEKWTSGNIEYIVDHLTRHMTVLGFQNITSTGSVTWTEAFADTDYTFGHDIREAQNERGVMRINTRTATSITYTLYDEVGTGDGGSTVHFCITGRIN